MLSYDHALGGGAGPCRCSAGGCAARGNDHGPRLVARALSFVRAIPYQRGKQKDGFAPGIAHPRKGDCDGKHAFPRTLARRVPELPIAMVYVPGHLSAWGFRPDRAMRPSSTTERSLCCGLWALPIP